MILKNILSKSDRTVIKNWFDNHKNKKIDFQVKGTLIIRQDRFLDQYLDKFRYILQNETGYLLKNQYTGIRMYTKGYSCERHVDNAAQFAISIIIHQSDTSENPLILYTNPPTTIILNEGDGVYFKGMDVIHERLPVKSDELLHLYLGYNIIHNSPRQTRLI